MVITKYGTSIPTSEKPFLFYNEIKSLIYEINNIHNTFSKNWNEKFNTYPLNLNKKQVRDVCNILYDDIFFIHETFFSNLREYMTKLDELIVSLDLDYTYNNFDFRSRVKQKESVVNKLKYYMVGKEGRGAYSINKCLNDLLGFRIVVEEFNHNCEIFDKICLEIQSDVNIKKINSSKNGYIGTHIYFYGNNNQFFPWELQVWNPTHAKSNDYSHSMYKQEYTKWANIYKNSEGIEVR